MTIRIIPCIALQIAFIILLSLTLANAANDPSLHFMNKQFDPVSKSSQTGPSPSSVANSDSQTGSDQIFESGSHYYILQFDSPVQAAWKETLKELGVTFFDYVPEYAFLIRADAAKESAMRTTPHVRWLGAYEPELKLSGSVYEVDDQQLKANDNKTALRILGFPGQDMDMLKGHVEALGASITEIIDTHWGITIIADVPITCIDKLKEISGIKWVEPVVPNRIMNNIATDIMQARGVRERVWSKSNSKLFGEGQVVGICDSGLDTGVISTMSDEFGDGSGTSRVISYTVASEAIAPDLCGHGTHVAGSVAGNGIHSGATPANSTYPSSSFAGLAPKAKIHFLATGLEDEDAGLAIPPMYGDGIFAPAYADNARIHTNSWGSSLGSQYTVNSFQVDQYMWDKKDFLILFSAGNAGVDQNQDGIIDHYSIGAPGTAKNCLTVGASENVRSSGGYSARNWGSGKWATRFAANPVKNDTTSNNSNGMAAFSSRGPTADGRYKPEIVAPGTNILSAKSSMTNGTAWGSYNDHYWFMGGTSMSTPLAAGAAALMREYLQKEENIATPSAALIKAALINGATDMAPGQYGTGATQELHTVPDTAQGWGRVNLDKSMNTDSYFSTQFNDITTSTPADSTYNRTFTYTVADSSAPFRTTMSWTDYPGSTAANCGLVNDLDLRVRKPDGTWTYPDNAMNLGTLSEVVPFGEGINVMHTEIDKVGVKLTPASYPQHLEMISLYFTNENRLEGNISLVVYNWNGAGPGEELLRKEYSYLPGGRVTLPVGVPVTSGSVFVAIMGNCKELGVNVVMDGNEDHDAYYNPLDSSWLIAPFTPDITGYFRTQAESTEFDRVNNTVSVTIPNPAPGEYTAEVTAHQIANGPQPYALVMSGLSSAIPVEGNATIGTDPKQPGAPEVDVETRERAPKSAKQVQNDYGVTLDSVYSDVVKFKASITNGHGNDLVSMRYPVTGLPATTANGIQLYKLLGNGQSLSFSYPSVTNYADGKWWLTTASGEFVPSTAVLNNTTTYYVVSVIRDNGPFDTNSASGIVEDPQVLSEAEDNSSGGSSGCIMGTGSDQLMTLLLVFAFALVVMRRNKKQL